MHVRAKFVCKGKKDGSVSFEPVIEGSEENKKFFEATPSGLIEMAVTKKVVSDMFEVGKEYYVDFKQAN